MSAFSDFKANVALPVRSVVVNDRQMIVDASGKQVANCDHIYDRMIEYGFSGTHADAARQEMGEQIADAINFILS